jgi:hypothetical protein
VLFFHLALYNYYNFFVIERICIKQLGDLFFTLKHVSCNVPEDHELDSKEGQRCLQAWLEYL